MKSFALALFAASASAANTWSKSGSKVTSGDLTLTPTVKTDWSISSSKMTVTWTTQGALGKKLEKDDEAQVWWCANIESGKNLCTLWQFKSDNDVKQESKARIYQKSTTSQPSVTADSNAKDWFDKSANGYSKKSEINFTGSSAATKESVKSDSKWKVGSTSNKKGATTVNGTYKTTEDATTTTSWKKGKSFSGSIGAYLKDNSKSTKKGSKTNINVQIKK